MNVVAVSFVLYTLVIAVIGLWSARYAGRSEADFLLADRGLGAWVAALSAAASAESGWVTLGLVGFAFTTGIAALWVVPGTVIAFLFNWFVLAPRLGQISRQHEALTIPAVLACRYSGPTARLIRIIGAVVILVMLTAYVAAQLNAAGKTFQGTFGWDYRSGVWLGMSIVLAYTVTGGFRAIAWTDVVQSLMMISAVTLVPILITWQLGGPGKVWHILRALEPNGALVDPFGGRSGLALLGFLTLWIGIPLGNPGQPHVLVRLMATRDRRAMVRGGIISTAWVFVLFSGAVMLGVTARAYYTQLADPEKTLPFLATDSTLIPGILGGMLVAAILAAICSTADSQLLVAASAVSHDLGGTIGRRLAGTRSLVAWSRGAVLLVGLAATGFALAEVRSVFTFVLDYGWAGLGAGFGPALILCLLSKRTTSKGVLSGMIVGVGTAVAWKQFPALQSQIYNLVPAFFLSFVTVWCVSRMTVEEQSE